jgi:divalent metal cation (Fe/Co/Zn/Cd) transporter
MKYHVDLHITVDGNISVTEGHHISHVLKDKLQSEMPEVSNILIHIEPSK